VGPSTAGISIRGKIVRVPAIRLGEDLVVVTGRLLKFASIAAEEFMCGASRDPARFVDAIRSSTLDADIFTFSQFPPDIEPRYPYFYELDNMAAIELVDYDYWWNRQIKTNARKSVRKSVKNGVVVRKASFDDEFVAGISEIYNETPIRQGRPFWHYGKSIEKVREENGTFIDRSDFIGAYFNSELIGFLKIVYTEGRAEMMQILSKLSHANRAPANALLAKAVELATEKQSSYLVYGRYTYGNKGIDSVSDFKRHNGFRKIDIPRYFVSLGIKGKIALMLKLHREISELIPQKVYLEMLRIRNTIYSKKVD
jgi:hypothetical protein